MPQASAAFESVSGMLARQARLRPGRRAFVTGEASVTFDELDRQVSRVAHALIETGVEPGQKVALLAGTTVVGVTVFLGAIRAGACAVPLPGGVAPDALARMISDSGARVLAAAGTRRPRLPSGVHVALDFEAGGWTDLSTWLSGREETEPGIAIGPEGDFDLIYSSGTTGAPKGILHPHRMRCAQVRRMARLGLGSDSTTLISTPLCSNATWIALLPALAAGGSVVLLPRFDALGFLTLSEQHRVTHAMLVPTQYRRILDAAGFEAFDLDSYRMKFSTGERLSGATKREILDRWPGRLVEIYGQTEGGPTTVLDAGAYPDKLDSVGRPAEGVEIRILDEEGREAPPGAIGEIAGSSESMMSGYHGRDDLTEAVTWRDEGGRAYLRTGDLGRLDEEGFLHLVGRRKIVIISGGVNVYPEDIEGVVSRNAAVAEVAVVGVPSRRWGETPLALVVPKAGARVAAADLLAWANERLGRAQRLSGLEFRRSLPRSPLGKLLRSELRPERPV